MQKRPVKCFLKIYCVRGRAVTNISLIIVLYSKEKLCVCYETQCTESWATVEFRLKKLLIKD